MKEHVFCFRRAIFSNFFFLGFAYVALKGAATLKARSGCKNMLHGSAPVLPIKDNHEVDFDFEKCRSMLGMGVHLSIETPDGL